MSKHTPGPWVKIRDPRVNPPWNYVVNSSMHNESHQQICVEVTEANARLIAAAPELLQSAKLTRQFLSLLVPLFSMLPEHRDKIQTILNAIDAVIEKATGEKLQ